LAHAGSVVEAHFQLGCTLFYKGEFVAARRYLEEGVALYTAKQPQFRTTRAVQHPGVACFAYLAWTLWFLGHPEHAWQRSHEALTLAREVAHPFSIGFALDLMATLHQSCGDIEAARDRASDLVALAHEQEFELWKATGTVTHGWALVRAEDAEQGVLLITEAMTALRTIGVEIARSYYELVLAEVQGRLGQSNEGITTLAKAQEVMRANSERFCEAELYRLKGELTLQRQSQANLGQVKASQDKSEDTAHRPLAPDPKGEAEACFLKAIDIAQSQQAKALELRAAVSLARLWHRQKKIVEARKVLKDVYAWFTDEAYTPELKRAKALLVALEKHQPAARAEAESSKQLPRRAPGGATPIRQRVS
jgi:tetratricopeptide (TPR) repeat protein